MADQTPIGANDGIIQTQQVASSVGPFAVDFPFFNLDDVIVVIQPDGGDSTTLVRGVDYMLAATANGDGIYPSGTVTLTTAVENTVVTRYRSTGLLRTAQFPTTGYLDRRSLNADLNRAFVAMQDLDRRQGLYIRLPDQDGGTETVLPPADQRRGMALMFDTENGAVMVGTPVSTDLVLGSFMLGFLDSSSAFYARLALAAPGLNEVNTFAQDNLFEGTATIANLVVTDTARRTSSLFANADDDKIPNTAWVQALITTRLADAANGSDTTPTIVELTSGTGATWTVPADVVWFEAEWIAGGGAGGGSGTGNTGGKTIFDGIEANPGTGGAGFNSLDGTGTPGRGGTGGAGGTSGANSATTIIRRGGAHGAMGSFASVTVPSAYGGDGAASLLGGAPGRGGVTTGVGTAAAANSGAGGGGYGASDGNGGGGGGGAGEYVRARYETVAASYGYTVGPGGAGSANSAAGGTGYIRIYCYFNH